MSNWAIHTYKKLKPLLEIMKEDIRGGPLIGMDETPVQVLQEKDRKNTTKSYMWVSRGLFKEKPILLYNYFPTRSSDFVKEYLDGYKGYLQTDGYKGYNIVKENEDIIQMGCWAHARRKFMAVLKASKNKGSANMALSYIGKLYSVEKEIRQLKLPVDKIKEKRQEKSKPVLEELKKWLDKKASQVPPKSLLGNAVSYTLSEWSKLIEYINFGIIPIDNNMVENAIRPFVIGRKNWLFSGSVNGAKASAGIYSIIETAKANGHEPFWYLQHLFKKLPEAKNGKDFQALLPYNLNFSELSFK